MVVAVCGGNVSWCNCRDHAQSAFLQGRAGRHVGESARASRLASILPSLLRLERRNRSDNLSKYSIRGKLWTATASDHRTHAFWQFLGYRCVIAVGRQSSHLWSSTISSRHRAHSTWDVCTASSLKQLGNIIFLTAQRQRNLRSCVISLKARGWNLRPSPAALRTLAAWIVVTD